MFPDCGAFLWSTFTHSGDFSLALLPCLDLPHGGVGGCCGCHHGVAGGGNAAPESPVGGARAKARRG